MLVTPQVIYTCRSVRTINDILASGISVFERYYQSMGVTETVYLQDAANNACIVGLQAGVGEWVYVPESFISGVPKTTGVKYSSIVIGVGLGAVPDSLNLEGIISLIQESVAGSIGVDPKIKSVLVSQPAFIDHDKHERLELARKAKITISESPYAKSKRLETENIELHSKIKQLETYIKRVS